MSKSPSIYIFLSKKEKASSKLNKSKENSESRKTAKGEAFDNANVVDILENIDRNVHISSAKETAINAKRLKKNQRGIASKSHSD